MKTRSTLTLLAGSISVILLIASTPAGCWQPTVPPFGSPVMGPLAPPCAPPPCGPAPMPFAMGPCMPQNCGSKFSVEGGGRVFYTSNSIKRTFRGQDIDFVRDLNFSQDTALGEIYVAGRLCPMLAVTYSFMFPLEDRGHGLLPGVLRVGSTTFAVGDRVSIKTTTTRHRWEGEVYPVVGCNYRLGGLILGELLVHRIRVEAANAEDSETFSKFLMGVGGVGEFAPASNVFARVKAAYMFLQDQNGVYLDGEGKYFPSFNTGCGRGGGIIAGARPYVGAGYRWRYSEWSKNDGNNKLTLSIHGPYAEVGVIF